MNNHAATLPRFGFKLNPPEIASARATLESHSTDLQEYELGFDFDRNLRELPHSPEDCERYAQVLLARVRLELENPEVEIDWLNCVRSAGMAGALLRMIGKPQQALVVLADCLHPFLLPRLTTEVFVQQAIRMADVLRVIGKFKEAQELLQAAQKVAPPPFLDFIHQHFGKLEFEQGRISDALTCFEKTLELRKARNDSNLLASTELAIQACRARLK
jgi:tetratricopeptide (TPR) repeat protein